MTAEFEQSIGAAPASAEAKPIQRPATFGLLERVSSTIPRFSESGSAWKDVLNTTNYCDQLDVALEERMGSRAVLDLKTATIKQAQDPEIVDNFQEAILLRALKWANKGLADYAIKAEAEEREERRFLARIQQNGKEPWSNPRKSGLPRGDGRYSDDERPRRAKRHNGRFRQLQFR